MAGLEDALSFEQEFPILHSVKNEQDLINLVTNNHNNTLQEVANLATKYVKLVESHAKLFNDNDSLLCEHEAVKRERDSYKATAVEVETLRTQLEPFLNNPSNEINRLNAQLTKLAFEKEQAWEIIKNNNSSTPRLSPEHPNPDPYHGDRKSLPIFLREIQSKLTANADWYPTEIAKMIHLKSRLRDKAYNAVIHGFGIDGTISFSSVQEIMTLLQESFGNTDEEGTAQSDIMTIKQNHKPTIEFLNEWSEIAAKTGFDDKAKIAHLKHALHPEVLIRLQHLQLSLVPLSTTLPGFLHQIRHIDSVIRSTNPDYVKSKITLPPSVLKTLTPDTHAHTPFTASEGGEAMDLNAATTKYAPPVWTNTQGNKIPQNDEERQARREFCFAHGLCNWCNAQGHKATFCAKAPWNSGKTVSKDGVTIEKGKA